MESFEFREVLEDEELARGCTSSSDDFLLVGSVTFSIESRALLEMPLFERIASFAVLRNT